MNRKRFRTINDALFLILRMEIKFYTEKLFFPPSKLRTKEISEGIFFLFTLLFFMFLINFFHSVSFFTSHLIAHFSCSLVYSSIENCFFLLLCFRFFRTLRNLFSLIFFLSSVRVFDLFSTDRFSSHVSRENEFSCFLNFENS